MKKEAKLLSDEFKLLQQDYERFGHNTELKIETFKIEGNELLDELKREVAKTEDILYSLTDKLKSGVDTFNQIKNADDKSNAHDILSMLKEVCMTFKDFAINHNQMLKAKIQMVTAKNLDYMEFIEKAFDFHTKITEKFQARMDFVNKIELEKEKLRGSYPTQADQKVE